MNQCIQPVCRILSQYLPYLNWNIFFHHYLSTHRIIDIMMNIGDFIGETDDFAFQCMRHRTGLMI